jgi:regulator of replication initiation timing
MLLQAQEMQLEVLDVRVQSAMQANKMMRLDNPVLRARLEEVTMCQAAAARVALPEPWQGPEA